MQQRSHKKTIKIYKKPELVKLGDLSEKTKGQGQTGGDWHSKRNTESKLK